MNLSARASRKQLWRRSVNWGSISQFDLLELSLCLAEHGAWHGLENMPARRKSAFAQPDDLVGRSAFAFVPGIAFDRVFAVSGRRRRRAAKADDACNDVDFDL